MAVREHLAVDGAHQITAGRQLATGASDIVRRISRSERAIDHVTGVLADVPTGFMNSGIAPSIG
jgi:hypothetical protein